MKTILATAYAVNPYKGSEDGMGWNFVLQIARFNRVVAITRENNRMEIERYMADHPDPRYACIQWEYFDLPLWMRWWKKGQRGAMPYFMLWQRAIPDMVRKRALAFDFTHNLNFHNDWTPSHLWKLGKPFVWGPVGHHPLIPGKYLQASDWRYWLADRLRWLVKCWFWHVSPALAATRRHAAHVWYMNKDVALQSGLPVGKCSVMPSVATEDYGCEAAQPKKGFQLISAGRLLPLKGFDLAIQAFAAFVQPLAACERADCHLLIVGAGPSRAAYAKLIVDLGVTDCVSIQDWMPRHTLFELYREGSGFLFPSHEGAGMVVAEALSFGLPVICLQNAGPGEFVDRNCGIVVPLQGYRDTVRGLADAIGQLHSDKSLRGRLRLGARARYEHHFHWDRRGEALRDIYQNIGA